jgi:hypothetical protein
MGEQFFGSEQCSEGEVAESDEEFAKPQQGVCVQDLSNGGKANC